MSSTSAVPSAGRLWAGRILSAVPVLMLLPSAIMKFMRPPMVVKQFTGKFGYPENAIIPIAVAEILCTVLDVFRAPQCWVPCCSPDIWEEPRRRTFAWATPSSYPSPSAFVFGQACGCAMNACALSYPYARNITPALVFSAHRWK